MRPEQGGANGHAMMKGEISWYPNLRQKKNYWQLRNADNRKNTLLQGRAFQFVI